MQKEGRDGWMDGCKERKGRIESIIHLRRPYLVMVHVWDDQVGGERGSECGRLDLKEMKESCEPIRKKIPTQPTTYSR